jgi:hypothetical protein
MVRARRDGVLSVLVLLFLLASALPLGPSSDPPGDEGGTSLPITGAQLTIREEYVVEGVETWDEVDVTTFGHLIIPPGTTLICSRVTMDGLAVVELTGGDMVIVGDVSRERALGMNGTCKSLLVSGGSTITVDARDQRYGFDKTRGPDVEINIRAQREVLVENARIELFAGDGSSGEYHFLGLDLKDRRFSGGDARLSLRTLAIFSEMLISNSTVIVQAGRGGDAADGQSVSSSSSARGGGYTEGGSVSGRVGAGGHATVTLISNNMTLDGSTLRGLAGNGGDAGDGGAVQAGSSFGAGGGGYSGGIGSGHPDERFIDGGDVSGAVGTGGNAVLTIEAFYLIQQNTPVVMAAGNGGAAGKGGDSTGIGGGGGGGYSGGGGGGGSDHRHRGGSGGSVQDEVGSGGDAAGSVTVESRFKMLGSAIQLSGGDAGGAGPGGTSTGLGGAGGGGFSGGGGAGSHDIDGISPPGVGGSGGAVTGGVASGGDAFLVINASRGILTDNVLRAGAGSGGRGTFAGLSNQDPSMDEWAGGGGGGSYSGGGGGCRVGSGTLTTDGGDAGLVEGQVGDGGDGTLRLEILDPTIHRNNNITASRGSGGQCWKSSAWGPPGGEGGGRMTAHGRAYRSIPMSRTILLAPEDGHGNGTWPEFLWMPLHDSTTYGAVWGYTFALSHEQNSVEPFYFVMVEGTASKTVGLMQKGAFYWRVRALYSRPFQQVGPWSDSFIFIRYNSPPTIDEIPTINVSVKVLTTVNLGRYLNDTDDPKYNLRLAAIDPAIWSIIDLTISLYYSAYELPHEITFSVSDGYEVTTGRLPIRLEDHNRPPRITSVGGYSPPVNLKLNEGEELILPIFSYDPDGDPVENSLVSSWDGCTMLQNGSIRISPSLNDIGTYTATVMSKDDRGGVARLFMNITVGNVGEPPLAPTFLGPGDLSKHHVGTPVTFRVAVDDPDLRYGELVTLTVISNVSGVLFTIETGEDVEFTTDALEPGRHRITAIVDDGTWTARSAMTLVVTADPEAPPVWEPPDETRLLLVLLVVAMVLLAIGFFFGQRLRERRSVT